MSSGRKANTSISSALSRYHLLTALFFLLAMAGWLGVGSRMARERFVQRGIPDLAALPMVDAGAELGLNVALEQYTPAELDAVLTEIERLGVQKLKQSFYFSASNSFDWAVADRIVTQVAARPTLELVPLLDGDPATDFAEPDLDQFEAWVAEFARRYGASIDYYFVWDEPNITRHWGNRQVNPDAYGALLAVAHAGIKAYDPTARLILAPLAPTTENNLLNQGESTFLQSLYDNGAAQYFDIVALKPYGFDSDPLDRRVDPSVLNFSRAILVRETMAHNGDSQTPVWVGNWGWNSLPADWVGPPSIWGEVDAATQAAYVVAGFERATTEWPWMGTMFLHHWEPNVTEDDPQLGFGVRATPLAASVADLVTAHRVAQQTVALPGFYQPQEGLDYMVFDGGWRFAPGFGADMSEKSDTEALTDPDRIIFHFNGTDVALRVRRANYRARLNILIDGEPANLLPLDDLSLGPNGRGSALVLNTNDPDLDLIETIPVASGLEPGVHEMIVTAHRGWNQWAIQGFAVGGRPQTGYAIHLAGLTLLATALSLLTIYLGRQADWMAYNRRWRMVFGRLSDGRQVALVFLAGIVLSLSGYFIWNGEDGSLFRRLGDGSTLLLFGGSALLFYATPWVWLYGLALLIFFWLTLQRPIWGIITAAFFIPFYVPQTLKPIFVYRFSPVEILVVVSFLAALIHLLRRLAHSWQNPTSARPLFPGWRVTDSAVLLFAFVATLSLLFTERLDVATNEWRTVIIGPILLYTTLRLSQVTRRELSFLLGGLIWGGLMVALIALFQLMTGSGLITAEGGLIRVRAHYGSPNNVALFLGRIMPFLLVYLLWGDVVSRPISADSKDKSTAYPGEKQTTFERRIALLFGLTPQPRLKYLVSIVLLTLVFFLTFSKGGILLGLPVVCALVLLFYLRWRGLKIWPWMSAGLLLLVVGYATLSRIPALAERLFIFGPTGDFRLNLWRSSLSMIRDQPLFGVGLDNFLYAYRGKYILSRAWQEPNLNHPHNIFFDFMTRLGLFGLLSGTFLFWRMGRHTWSLVGPFWRDQRLNETTLIGLGVAGALGYTLGHGLVDHTFFLVDLAYTFFLLLGVVVTLDRVEPE